jgi:hypothetical protein
MNMTNAKAIDSPRQAGAPSRADAEHPRPAGDHHENAAIAPTITKRRRRGPRRQREQVEGQRPSEDRVRHRGARAEDRLGSGLPEEREDVPLAHDRGAGRRGDHERAAKRDETDDRFDRQLYWLAVDQDWQPRQLPEPWRLQREKRAVQDQKRRHRKESERLALEPQAGPEHVGDAE